MGEERIGDNQGLKIFLKKFITDNEELEELESKINEFNPFRILKIEDFEIRHSNVLSWLFNPNENHGFGDYLLKKFILKLFKQNDNIKTKMDFSMIEGYDFSDLVIYREYKNIDLVIQSEKNKLIIIIENKIKSKESNEQLKKYKELIKVKFPDYEKWFVYLTLTGFKPSDDEYAIFSYEQIYEILKFAIKLMKDKINAKIYNFIDHYLHILERLLMKEEDIQELCKRIYNKHKDAIDLINEYSTADSFYEAMKEFINENEDLVRVSEKSSRLSFLPKKIEELSPKEIMEPWLADYPILFWFVKIPKYDKIGLALEVGPFKDSEKRLKFIRFLKENYFKELKEPNLNSKYTRILSDYEDLVEWDDKDKIKEIAEKMWKKFMDLKDKITKAFEQYSW